MDIKSCTFFPFFLSLLTFCVLFMVTIREPETLYRTRYNVRVVNGFTNNSSLPLVIWCASPENDMGGRALQEGDDYSWSQTTNFLGVGGNTRVFCTLKWDQMRKKFDAFYIYRDSYRCSPFKMCVWMVKEDGFYFSNDGLLFHKDFSWT
ncbi:S-protein homolog 1-like [Chenopodium quinoa]|uniref:S-protein homolog 1-like n=1 Tax=Chenopodium quinoa TaxID=63459 RepID=UPI000B796178|nr:S-protein homolog 1-like [Chenopodium quinoa]